MLQTGKDLAAYRAEREKGVQATRSDQAASGPGAGRPIMSTSSVYCMYDDVVYQLDGLIKAVDVCFKTFFVLNAKYPAEAINVWTLLQKAVFGISTHWEP